MEPFDAIEVKVQNDDGSFVFLPGYDDIDALPDELLTVGIGPDGRRQVVVKRTPDGLAQACYLIESAAQAELTMANTQAVEANTAALLAMQKELATQNDLSRQILKAGQDQAAAVASGTNYAADFAATSPGPLVLVVPDADRKVVRVIVSAATLLGNLLGGGAKITLYHAAKETDGPAAAGAVVLGTYPIASNASYAVQSGRAVPKGRFLKAAATNLGCGISLDVA